jgi:uncharacterized membrane protein YGL010W
MAFDTADDWFEAYGESHQHPTNKLIHFIFVPLIMLSLLGLLWASPLPAAVRTIPYLNVASVFVLGVIFFYARLSLALALGMVLIAAAMIGVQQGIYQVVGQSNGLLALVNFGIFLVSWVFQFIGHKIEGKKPSFIQDLQFLLIGPMWILGFIYRSLGIRY